jgi:hypothetical protein
MTQPFKPFCVSEPHFDGKEQLSQMTDGRRWVVEHSFTYHNGDELSIVVPAGFITDLASVPRLFWNIFPPFGKYTRAAIVHDVLYSKHTLGRAICDGIFLEAMRTDGVGAVTRYTLWLAVRLFGWAVFNRKRHNHEQH